MKETNIKAHIDKLQECRYVIRHNIEYELISIEYAYNLYGYIVHLKKDGELIEPITVTDLGMLSFEPGGKFKSPLYKALHGNK